VKVDTGVPVTAGQILDLILFAAPNGVSIGARLVDAVTGNVLVDDVMFSTNLPVNTVFMFAHASIRSTVGTTPALLALNRLYVECDL
jgi:hypothetical protein